MKLLKKRIRLLLGTCFVLASLSVQALSLSSQYKNIDYNYRGKSLTLASQLCDTNKLPLHLTHAMRYIGYREYKNNSGNFVDWLLESCNIKPGSHASWCAGFVSKMMDLAKVTSPSKRTALAQGYRTKESIKARDVKFGGVKLKQNTWYLVIWQKGTTSFGHIGFLLIHNNNYYYVIEGNGATGTSGDQSNGGMVVLRSRRIEPNAYFRITWFTEIKYNGT